MDSSNAVYGNRSLGLVGGGKWGKNLARVFNDQQTLHTICDYNEELLNTYLSLYKDVKTTSHYQKILDDPSIRQVAIATPPPTHFNLVKQALLAGKDVFVEKPLCLHKSEAQELAQIAYASRSILMVGHILQYHPIVNLLQNILRNKVCGDLLSLHAQRYNPLTAYKEEDVLWDLAPHDISVILSLCPNQILKHVHPTKTVYSKGDILDVVYFKVEFESNIKVILEVSRLSPFKQQKLVVVCSKASFVFDDTKDWEDKLSVFQGHENYKKLLEMEFKKIQKAEPLRQECDHFMNCCLHRQIARTNAEEAIPVVDLLQQVHTHCDQLHAA